MTAAEDTARLLEDVVECIGFVRPPRLDLAGSPRAAEVVLAKAHERVRAFDAFLWIHTHIFAVGYVASLRTQSGDFASGASVSKPNVVLALEIAHRASSNRGVSALRKAIGLRVIG